MNDKQSQKQHTPQQPEQASPSRPEPIAVKSMKFVQSVDLPGKPGASSVSTDKKGAHYHELAYLPWMRHHRITWHQAGEGRTPQTVYVHESNVSSWDAA